MPFWVLAWFKRFYQASKIAGSNSGPKEGKTQGAGGFFFLVDALNFSALEKKKEGQNLQGIFVCQGFSLSWLEVFPGYLDFGMMAMDLWRCWPGTWVSNQNLSTSPPPEAKHPKKSQSHERRKGLWH